MRALIVLAVCAMAASCKSNKDKEAVAAPEEWQLTQKKLYTYKINSLGRVDTTYIKNLVYKDAEVTDSSLYFSINKYQDDRLVGVDYFDADAKKLTTAVEMTYNRDGKLLSSRLTTGDRVGREERYTYDTGGRVKNYSLIQAKQETVLPDQLEGPKTSSNSAKAGYDTMRAVYGYDKEYKVVSTVITDPRGAVLRRDTNLYSGAEPLATYAINHKGDTIQRNEYKVKGNQLSTKIDNDSFTLYQGSSNGFPLGQITIDKTKKEQWKKTIKYDTRGRKLEEALYKLVQ